MKPKAGKPVSKASSSVIKPGTGSGSRPTGGKTTTPVSAPMDKQGLGRKPAGKTLK
jgi:hypothetical protein